MKNFDSSAGYGIIQKEYVLYSVYNMLKVI